MIASKVDNENITFELEHDARIIARNTGSTPQKVEEMMRYFVNERLFESIDGVITCFKLARRLDKSMTSNPQMREIIGKLKNHDSIMTQSAKPMQDKIRLDQTRVDKNKDTASDSRFSEFWDMYAKKVDSKKCEAKFKKLTNSEIEMLFSKLPDYIKSTPDKQYRKNPLTWINGKCWNDEIQKQIDLPGDCGIDFKAIAENFNKSMAIWPNVPEVVKVTEKQKNLIAVLVSDYAMTDERFQAYFEHCANSGKHDFVLNNEKIPAKCLTYFLSEDTIQK